MNLLIAHDGTAASDAILHDLPKAGLPPTGSAIVLCVADAIPLGDVTGLALPGEYTGVAMSVATLDDRAVVDAKRTAERVAAAVSALLPSWEVKPDHLVGTPADAIVGTARNWPADLVMVGSAGKGRLGRFFLGSVSKAVVNNAPCSVRVARPSESGGVPRLLIGYDGSADADRTIRVVAERRWPAGTQVRLIMAEDVQVAHAITVAASAAPFREEGLARMHRFVRDAEQVLRDAGLTVTVHFDGGDPKDVLLREAAAWKPDCVFVGSRGPGRVARVLLGSVSSAVASGAPCSVEVVRDDRGAT